MEMSGQLHDPSTLTKEIQTPLPLRQEPKWDQSRSGHYVEDKNPSSLLGIEHCSPGHSLVTIPTELYWIHIRSRLDINIKTKDISFLTKKESSMGKLIFHCSCDKGSAAVNSGFHAVQCKAKEKGKFLLPACMHETTSLCLNKLMNL
jgi:hypothetical protein